MPDALLNLNLGQVQAVIHGYSERILDEMCNAVWMGYYAGYYSRAKNPQKPTMLIQNILSKNNVGDSSRGNTTQDTDMDAELELFAQRDLAFLQLRGGNSDNGKHKSRS